jgi:hypothetical protein
MSLVITGLLLVIWTLPEFAYKLKNYIQLLQINMTTKYNDTNFLITSAIKIVLGIIAVIFAKSISTALVKDKNN